MTSWISMRHLALPQRPSGCQIAVGDRYEARPSPARRASNVGDPSPARRARFWATSRAVCVAIAWAALGVFMGSGMARAETIRLEFRAAGEATPAAETRGVSDPSDESSSREDQFLVLGLAPETRQALARRSWDSAQWQQVFRVQTEGADPSLPPLLGRYEVTADGLRFVPRFPPRSGRSYQVTLDLARLPDISEQDARRLEKLITLAASQSDREAEDQPEPRLVAIYPRGSVLPENQLKFYLHFSTSMRRGDSYRHIRLWVAPRGDDELSLDAASVEENRSWTEIEFPFLELPEELWDPQYQRFTLFFDPGRIKRGLKPREEFGPALEEGRRYVLEVDRQWRSASGKPLAETVRKEFHVVAPDDDQPRAENWRVIAPSGAKDWLRLEFDEPLDHGMLERVLHVEDARGRRLPGETVIDREETRWSFRPETHWEPGDFAVVVGTHLEDRAGNSLAKPFEVDLFEEVERQVETGSVRLPFRVETR